MSNAGEPVGEMTQRLIHQGQEMKQWPIHNPPPPTPLIDIPPGNHQGSQ